MNDVEKKLKDLSLPRIKLPKHQRVFFSLLFKPGLSPSFWIPTMIKIREVVMLVLIVALTAVNLLDFGKPADLGDIERAFAAQLKAVEEKVEEVEGSIAALKPDNLVILSLDNQLASRAGERDEWIIIHEYEKKVALFAVLPAGVPPYTWSLDKPIMELKPTSQGFLVKGIVKSSGIATLRVKDSSGLTGELKIRTEGAAGPLETIEIEADE